MAKTFGATQTINSSKEDAVEKVMNLTKGRGVDTAIEAVGVPATFELCEAIIDPGGHIANIGVHGKSRNTSYGNLVVKEYYYYYATWWIQLQPRCCIKMFSLKNLILKNLITHHFRLDEIMKAYDTFGNAAEEKALKVILTN